MVQKFVLALVFFLFSFTSIAQGEGAHSLNKPKKLRKIPERRPLLEEVNRNQERLKKEKKTHEQFQEIRNLLNENRQILDQLRQRKTRQQLTQELSGNAQTIDQLILNLNQLSLTFSLTQYNSYAEISGQIIVQSEEIKTLLKKEHIPRSPRSWIANPQKGRT